MGRFWGFAAGKIGEVFATSAENRLENLCVRKQRGENLFNSKRVSLSAAEFLYSCNDFYPRLISSYRWLFRLVHNILNRRGWNWHLSNFYCHPQIPLTSHLTVMCPDELCSFLLPSISPTAFSKSSVLTLDNIWLFFRALLRLFVKIDLKSQGRGKDGNSLMSGAQKSLNTRCLISEPFLKSLCRPEMSFLPSQCSNIFRRSPEVPPPLC